MICTDSSHQRISFSSDLGQSDKAPMVVEQSGPVRRDVTLLDTSNSDFEFHISKSFDPGESSPADEIFADGMILPVLPFQVTAAATVPKRLYKYELPPITSSNSLPQSPLPQPPMPDHSRKHGEKESSGRTSGANSDSEAEKSSKSFWSFRRSSSLNCDIKKTLICSFPRLTRSNSTGSVTNSKRVMLREVFKHHSQRPASSSSSSSVCCNAYQFRPQKHTAKKDEGGSFRVFQVPNGPSSFGSGSISRNTKDKKKKKNKNKKK